VNQGATILDLQGRLARPSERRFERGERCGPYEIVRLMAAGGFGDVYEGVHHLLRRPVAIKILQDRHANRDELRSRLEQEARVLSEIKNPHMVTVYDAGEQDGRVWMAMELLHGKTLREILEQGQPLPVSHALHHAACVANGVAAAHDLRVVHRDLKPENVFVTSDGHTVVLDLGTAKVLGDVKGRQTQRIIGTVAYMSPEHLLGGSDGLPIDQRTDIYSLSLMLYEMLAGFHPFALARNTRTMPSWNELVKKQLEELPEPLEHVAPWVPDYVCRIVRTGISKEREARHATMRELEIELRQAAKWFVEERAASDRAGRAKAVSLDADTHPDPIPRFTSADTEAGSPPVRRRTERLDAAALGPTERLDAPALVPTERLDAPAQSDSSGRETRTACRVKLPSPVPGKAAPGVKPPSPVPGKAAPGVKPPSPVPVKAAPGVKPPSPVPGEPARRAPARMRMPIPLRVLLAPVAGAAIGLLIVWGMKVKKRHVPAASSAEVAAPTVPVVRIDPTDTPQPAHEGPSRAATASAVTTAKAEREASERAVPARAVDSVPRAKPPPVAVTGSKNNPAPIHGDDEPFLPGPDPAKPKAAPGGRTRPIIDDDAPFLPAPAEPEKPVPVKPKSQGKTPPRPALPGSGL
jgi:serine/threonine-protein kinase